MWAYDFTVQMTGGADMTGSVTFFARMAAGAHRFTGSSLALNGTPSLGNLQIAKPAPGAGTPDLALTKSGPATTAPGQTITYVLNYQNKLTATDAATGVQLKDVIPAGLTYVPGSCTGICTVVGDTITWELGTVAVGATGSRSYQATVGNLANNATFTNNAEINSSQNETNFNDNKASVTTTVKRPSISGTVLDDLNGDGLDNDGSVGLAGATVQLFFDTNGNGAYNAGTDLAVAGQSVTTNATGNWTLEPGTISRTNRTYFVLRTNPAGYTSTSALAGTTASATPTVVTSDQIKVVFAAGGAGTTGTTANNRFLAKQIVNQAPTANAQSVTTLEDTSKLITLTGSDPEASPLSFTITSLPAAGKLYKGNSTAAADEITSVPTTLAGATVTYVPAANESGSPYTTFKFRVNDGSLNSPEATVTVNVTPVNDAPAGTDGTEVTDEDTRVHVRGGRLRVQRSERLAGELADRGQDHDAAGDGR